MTFKTALTRIVICGIGLYSIEPVGARTAVTRGPYLQTPTPTSVIVRWRTDVAEGAMVKYGRTSDKLDQIATSPGKFIDHIVQLKGLASGTDYFYQIGNGIDNPPDPAGSDATPGTRVNKFRTAPPTGPAAELRAWILGDPGKKGETQRAVRDAYIASTGQERTDFVMLLGDNAYTEGTDTDYQRAIFETYEATLLSAPVWSVIGNHDVYSASSVTQSGVYYDIFSFPTLGQAGGLPSGTEAYYSFDWANVHFICLDSQDSDRSPDGLMMQWLKADLAGTSRDWIVAVFHHPPYSRGTHNSDVDGDSGNRLRDMRETFLPVLENGGVDLILTGHSHVYERTFLIDGHYGKGATFDPTKHVRQPGDGRKSGGGVYYKSRNRTPHQGEPVVVLGSSGKAGTTGKTPALDYPAMVVALCEPGSGILEVNGLKLNFTFLRETGERKDHFTIEKR